MKCSLERLMILLRLAAISLLFGTAAIVAPFAASAQESPTALLAMQDEDDEETPEDEKTPENEETPEDDVETPKDDETPEDEEFELDPDWEDAGLISETEYESPQYGYSVEWGSPILLDLESRGGPVATEPESTDEMAANDYLWLYTDDPLSYIGVYGYSFEEYGYADEDEAIEDWVGYWVSSDYLGNEDIFGADAEVLLEDEGTSSGGVVIYDTDDDDLPYIRYKEIFVSEDKASVIALDFSGYVEDIGDLEDTLGEVQIQIEIDGELIFSTFDLDEVVAAVEDYQDSLGIDDDPAASSSSIGVQVRIVAGTSRH